MATVHSVAADGTVHVPSFDLAFSTIASGEAREAFVRQRTKAAESQDAASEDPPPIPDDIEAARKQADEEIVLPLLAKQFARWPDVAIEPIEVGGVYAENFTPRDGVGERNKARVLINVHGGGFMVGARAHGQLESIPIAAQGQIKVVSVDYRMAPEHRFPAATEDLAVVYESLLGEYEPERIGIYGSSAGGILTAQSIPWFLEHDLRLPGGIAMLGGSGQSLYKGDSTLMARHVFEGAAGFPAGAELDVWPYFEDADMASRLASPMLWPDVLAEFPPSLLVTGSRAYEMSSIIDAHNKLTLAGARSQLHVWDGLGHCFYLDADLPESREAEKIIIRFFSEALA